MLMKEYIGYNLNIKQKLYNRFMQSIKEVKKTKYLQILILPGLIFYIIFCYMPMYGIIIAFEDFNMRQGMLASTWVGFENFNRFLSYPEFYRLIRNTLAISIFQLLITFPTSIIFALFLNEMKNNFYKKFVQTASYLPHFISVVAIAGMLNLILSPNGGIVNNIIVKMGMQPIYFMIESKWFRTIYISSDIWQTMGWGAIVYLAALSGTSPELYEAATIDGAGRIKKMLHISLPSIAPTVFIMLIFKLGNMMNLGTDKALLLQHPLTYEVSDVIGTYIYRRGLVMAEYSFSTAVGLFNSLINLVLIISANWLSKKYTENSLW